MYSGGYKITNTFRLKIMTTDYNLQVPYLEDPNTGIQMFESAEIVEYIKATYALWEAMVLAFIFLATD